jgi:hypothetical protein
VTRSLPAVLLLALAGCGYYGPPQPPALNIPRPIADLRVSEIGDRIVIRFTPPDRTTEDLPVTSLQSIDLYVGPGEVNFDRNRWLSSARRYQVPASQTGELIFEISAADRINQQLILAVRTTGKSGRESDLSNYTYLTVAPPLLTPSAPALTNTADGVHLQWTGDAPRYRILRTLLSAPDAQPEPLAEVDMSAFLDQATVIGARYQYVILGLSGEAQQSLPSAPSAITPADMFAPATPTGLTPVAGVASIDLSWSRNTEDDLAGYNLFRSTDDGPFTALATNLSVPAFTDTQVESGRQYRYSVSAIDMSGNESDRSEAIAARIE